MAIFLNIFIKTFAVFISILTIIILSLLLLSNLEVKDNNFTFLFGNEKSNNVISIIELDGLIIEKKRGFSNLSNQFIISPSEIKNHLDAIKKLSPKIIIFSINSPGGTVSASKEFYNIIKNFKKNNKIEILFHTNELLASGAYWAATSADEIYASYGSIIGSIGVKGPDWFFYDHPKTISTGIFGNRIETKNGIKIFSNKAGASKDIFNPFRKPTTNELNHLQDMVDKIYDDFVMIISKERKIEIDLLINNIGALIYTSNKASKLHLIDKVFSLNELIDFKIKYNNFKNYKVIKINNTSNSLIKDFLSSKFNKNEKNIIFECLSLRSSISAILNYQTTGC